MEKEGATRTAFGFDPVSGWTSPWNSAKEINLDRPPIVMPWNSRWDGPNIKWPYYFANEGYRERFQLDILKMDNLCPCSKISDDSW